LNISWLLVGVAVAVMSVAVAAQGDLEQLSDTQLLQETHTQ
jgi:hypothetical protein